MNYNYLHELFEKDIEVEIMRATEAEMDKMWNFVHDKSQQYWSWWAIDHNTGVPPAFCFGNCKHKYLKELTELFKGFSITIAYTDGNPAYKEEIIG